MFFIVVYALLFCMHMSYAMLMEERIANLFLNAVHTDTFDQLAKKYQKISPVVKKELFKKADENELIKSVIIACAVPDGIRDHIVMYMCRVNPPVSTVFDILTWQARVHDLSQRLDFCVKKQHIKQCGTLALFLRSSEHDFDHIESLLQLLENDAVDIRRLSKQQMDHIILMPKKFLLLCEKMHYSVIKYKVRCNLYSLFVSVFALYMSVLGFDLFVNSYRHELNETSSGYSFAYHYYMHQNNYHVGYAHQHDNYFDAKIAGKFITVICFMLACCNFDKALTLWDERKVDFDTLVEKCIKRREKVTF